MRHRHVCTGVAVLAAALIGGTAWAQKGTGEASGMGRRADKPPIVSLSGTVKETKVGPCKLTTGRSSEGAHLIVQTRDRTINLHLGPSAAVADVLKAAPAGQALAVQGFRTDRMPADAYVAKTVTVGDRTFTLRDDRLRPRWAAGRGGGRGQGFGRGPGWRRGYGGCF
ncbi:hypothetical protein J2S22_000458 [Rhodoplanes tepidamans]|uniref:Magnetosome protein MamS/MamX domain-containing protein n=1 Tax=Rhodoplanes tepidamans TaxID=200616 RepID=A0ABT5J6N9_RHOTP|nr:hypothetical protein [Rhodoplanes tepidamans]MDC7785294.1 hypothetical protein [Rhodoplanes tepidamans]MDQ0353552.1 hypothetical protein [Rhodoplanes tepidamans]